MIGSREKKEIGFQLSYAAQVDTENQDQLQIHANAPVGASAAELAVVVATMRDAVWLERIACNERILKRAKIIEGARDAKVAALTAVGEDVDAEMLAEERAITNATILKMSARLEADNAVVNGHGPQRV